MTIANEKKQLVFAYLDIPRVGRTPKRQWCRENGISPITLEALRGEWRLDRRDHKNALRALDHEKERILAGNPPDRRRNIVRLQDATGKYISPEEFDIVAYFKQCAPAVAKAIVEGSKRLNATSQRHFLQVLGLLVEKSEQKVEVSLTADDHFRIRNEAKRRVSAIAGATDGAGSVQPESHLLPESVRQDTGCEPGDTSVQTVETSD